MIGCNHLAQTLEYGMKALRQRAILRFNATAGDVAERIAGFINHAKTGYAQTGINAENTNALTPCSISSAPSS